MAKAILDAHPSVVVVHCRESGKLLFSVYDSGYPRKAYRGSANNIGGNPSQDETDPEQVLIREVCEEFHPNHPAEKKYLGKVLWAPDADIRAVRNGLLARVEPLQDFLVTQKGPIEGGNKPYTAIYTVFSSQVDPCIIKTVERNLREGKNIPTEGDLGVYTLEQLANHPRGKFSTAHITAHILNWRFGSNIPYPEQLVAVPIGTPRRTFSDYLCDFERNLNMIKRVESGNF